jgi:hypothetical protein
VLGLLEESGQPHCPAVVTDCQVADDRLGDLAGGAVLRRDDHDDAGSRDRLGRCRASTSWKTPSPFRTRARARTVPVVPAGRAGAAVG